MRRDKNTLEQLLAEGATPAGRVLSRLGTSKPSLSRRVRSTPGVLRIGRTRATHYALAREIRTYGSKWPVYRIGEDGRASHCANLHALQPREWWYEFTGPRPGWLAGEFSLGVFPDLPWFLDDLRPQGFVGRAFARRYSEELGLPADPTLWGAEGVLVSLLLHGEDLPGDFLLGDRTLDRFQRASLSAPRCIPSAERAARYPDLAAAALQGEVPGSSAGGEQPKFTACVDDHGQLHQAIVKLSPLRDTAGGRRWADLLVCEHLASTVLREGGISACRTELVEGGGRVFLEAQRFDRVGAFGRRPFVSLLPLDSAYYGKLDSWSAAAERLERDGWLGEEDANSLRLLWWFGGLIGNTDMHFGNAGLLLGDRPCRLAPAYDMLPMLFRPDSSGEVPPQELVLPLPRPDQRAVWARAAALALEFWRRVAQDGRLEPTMRSQGAKILGSLRPLLDRFG
ncbi:MAG TPA: type II toxin-antitoxin system HipA family toxin YjjJ [Myxococcales bacterium]|jgi:hypothetical protein